MVVKTVLIAGAGPSGLCAALKLVDKAAENGWKLNIVVVDAGNALEHRANDRNIPTNVSFGAGGAGLISDGKWTGGKAGTKAHDLDGYAEAIADVAGLMCVDKERLLPSAGQVQNNNEWLLKQSESIQVDLDKRIDLIARMIAKCTDAGVEFRWNTTITHMRFDADSDTFVTLTICGTTQVDVQSHLVVLAVGRLGPCTEILRRQTPGVSNTVYRRLEIGIRIEGASSELLFEDKRNGRTDIVRDPKWKCDITNPENKEQRAELRSFCWCKDGAVVLVDGQKIGAPVKAFSGLSDCTPTGRTNIGLNVRLTENYGPTTLPNETTIVRDVCLTDIASAIASAAGVKHKDKWWLKALQLGVNEFVKSRMTEADVEASGKFNIHCFTVEGVREYPDIHETTLFATANEEKRVIVCGDASGIFRGLVPAMASGICAGNNLFNEHKQRFFEPAGIFLNLLAAARTHEMFKSDDPARHRVFERSTLEAARHMPNLYHRHVPGMAVKQEKIDYEVHCFLSVPGDSPVDPSEQSVALYREAVNLFNTVYNKLGEDKIVSSSGKKMKTPILGLVRGKKKLTIVVMQSAMYFPCTLKAAALEEALRHMEFFRTCGFLIHRVKIEAPASKYIEGEPQTREEALVCPHYWEMHLKVQHSTYDKATGTVPGKKEIDQLFDLSVNLTKKMSRPVAFSFNADRKGEGQRFLNTRGYKCTYGELMEIKKKILDEAQKLGWRCIRAIEERVVWDTNWAFGDPGWIDMATPVVIAVSGKSFAGKSTFAKALIECLSRMALNGQEMTLSSYLKNEYLQENHLSAQEFVSRKAKETHRLELIQMLEQKLAANPTKYFDKLIADMQTKRGFLIVSDLRLEADAQALHKFVTEHNWPTFWVRLTIDEVEATSRGWKFAAGVHDHRTETELDGWDVADTFEGSPIVHYTASQLQGVTDEFAAQFVAEKLVPFFLTRD